MKSILSLRILSLLGFLLLFAPFYQQCTFGRVAEAPAEEAPVTEEGIPLSKAEQDSLVVRTKRDSIYEVQKPIYDKAYEFIDDDDNDNAYEMAFRSITFFKEILNDFSGYKGQLQKDLRTNKFDLIFLPIKLLAFVPIIFLTVLNVIESFKIKPRRNKLYALWNLLFLAISLICILFFDSLFDTYEQIKWGFYVFPLVQIGILTVSRKIQKSENA